MEPVTHLLTGACLARSGLNRRAAYTTLAMVIAAELPDMDTLWGLRGPIQGFEHHRGITHTFLGIPFEAAFVVLLIFLLHRWRLRRTRSAPVATPTDSDHVLVRRPLTAAPVRWGVLYGFCLIALLSHLLLDYTNNYGLRPFFPFNPHWYAASIVFIFDPLLFAFLLIGLLAPSVFRWIGREVGAKRQPFVSRGWAIAALIGVVCLWTVRWWEHDRAVRLVMAQSVAQPGVPDASQNTDDAAAQTPTPEPNPVYLPAVRALASPDPFSIFRWYTVTDFGPMYQLERVDTLDNTVVATEGTYAKPERDAATLAAEASPLGRVYVDWSPMPIITVDRSATAASAAPASLQENATAVAAVVTFRDPRFMGALPLRSEGSPPPLSATVELDQQNRVIGQAMGSSAEPQR